MKTKICSKCKRKLNTSKFHTDKLSKDNLYYICKLCAKKQQKSRRKLYQSNIEKGIFVVSSFKICSKCGKKKNKSEFCKDSYTKDGLRSYCKKCGKKYDSTIKSRLAKRKYSVSLKGKETKNKYHYSPEGIYVVIKSSAKRRNLSCNLNRKEFIEWYIKQDKLCHYCHKTERQSFNDMNRKLHRLTIDRKDNNKGYTLDNIVLSCYKCNMIKSNDISYNQMLKIGKILKK